MCLSAKFQPSTISQICILMLTKSNRHSWSHGCRVFQQTTITSPLNSISLSFHSLMTYHDSPKKNQFIGAVFAGLPLEEAARQHQIPHSTTQGLWWKFVKTGSTHALPHTGRPAKVTPRLTRHLVRDSKKNRRQPLRELGNNPEINVPLPSSTVHSLIKDIIGGRLGRWLCLPRSINKLEKPGQHSINP